MSETVAQEHARECLVAQYGQMTMCTCTMHVGHPPHYGDCPKAAPEKPLHVRVAEALGRGPFTLSPYVVINGRRSDTPTWIDAGNSADHPGAGHYAGWEPPRYDRAWELTGPLIEKYEITLLAPWGSSDWQAIHEYDLSRPGYRWANYAWGKTPLLAACNLLLDLHRQGKLVARG